MALDAKLDRDTTLSSDGTILTAKDDTGAYEPTDNPGGFGTPNPDRSTVYLLAACFKMVAPDQLEGVPITVYDGLTATQFFANITSDGLYDWRLIPVNSGVPVGTIAVGTVFHDPLTGLIQQTITADSTLDAVTILDTAQEDPYTSEQVELLLLALDNTSDDRKVDFVPVRYDVRRSRLVYLINTKKCHPGYQDKLDDLRTKREGAFYNYAQERYYVAVDLMDLIECIFNSIPDIENP